MVGNTPGLMTHSVSQWPLPGANLGQYGIREIFHNYRKGTLMADVASRWKVVLGALLIQLCLGAIYAWSVFTPGLKDAGWSNARTQVVFSVGLASFALVMVFAGR